MPVRSRVRTLWALVAVTGLIVAGCSGDDDSASGGNGNGNGHGGKAGAGGSGSETVSCAPDDLDLVNDGVLTIGTDSPAFPPWFEDDDPTNGKGFESAVAYAVADQLGFSKERVTWATVTSDRAFARGKKDVDFDIDQVPITADRAEAVDFSDGYYDVNQAIVGFVDSPAAQATTLDDVKVLRLGAQAGSTSLAFVNDVIQPDRPAFVYQDDNAAKVALDAKQVDGIVLDLPTAFYLSSAKIEGTAVIGQFPPVAEGQEPDQFGMVFQRGNPLRDCVDDALAELKDSGELADITQQWLSDAVDAQVIPVDAPGEG
jgi:polar amino acid transport system substrate-binding protein